MSLDMCHRDVGIQELYVTIQRTVNLNSVKLSANFGLTLTRTLSKRLIFTKVSVSIMCSRDSCFSPLSLLCLPSFSQRYENSCPYPLPLLHHLPFPLCSIAFLHPFPSLLLEWQVNFSAHFSISAFLDFSATQDTNTQFLFENHSSHACSPYNLISCYYPTNILCSSHSYLFSGPWNHHFMHLWFFTFCSYHQACLLTPLKLSSVWFNFS